MTANNQYTKSNGGRMWGGNMPTKFSVNLSPEEADQLDKAARITANSKAELVRQMVAFVGKRVDAIIERYPDIGSHLMTHLGSPAAGFEMLLWDLDNPRFVKWQKSMEMLRKGKAEAEEKPG